MQQRRQGDLRVGGNCVAQRQGAMRGQFGDKPFWQRLDVVIIITIIGMCRRSCACSDGSLIMMLLVIINAKMLIITGLGDRLAPPEQAELLWEHWDRCKLHWFPGNHILHVSQPDYLRRMNRFLRPFMF